MEIPFAWVRVHGRRVFASGHGSLSAEGVPAGPFGRVPDQISVEQGQESAVAALLSMLGGLQREVGNLDRVAAWLTLSAFVNAEPGYSWTTLVVNPVSTLIVDLFGSEVGAHARTAPGVAALPFDLPVVLAAELEFAGLPRSAGAPTRDWLHATS